MNKGYSENELKDKRSFRRILELQVKPIKGDFNLS